MRRAELEDPRLVEVYDAEHLWGWEEDFFMAALAERSAPRVLDLGCGTGRLAIAMAAAGHDVTAVDPSRPALDAARRKPGAERVRWVQATATTLPDRVYDTVLMTDHVSQLIISDRAWAALLRQLRRSLDRGGRLIFDSRDPASRRWVQSTAEESGRRITLPGGATVTLSAEVTPMDAGRVSYVRHYRFADGTELSTEATLRLRTEEQLRRTVEGAGFDVDRVYGGWAREPVGLSQDGELIVLAVVRPEPRQR